MNRFALIRDLQTHQSSVPDDLFCTLFRDAVAALEWSLAETAEKFGISEPTVRRWLDSMTAPHPSLRRTAFQELASSLLEKFSEDDETPQEASAIPLILSCPVCHERHIDVGEFASRPHRTHACQHCGVVWRPALVPTVGVRFLPGYGPDLEGT